MLYTMRDLIYNKYGEDRFALGCEIVARWVNFEIKDLPAKKLHRWTQQHVVDLCNAESGSDISFYYEEAEALRQLFGLQSINQLYKQ